jgi:hypothetical protein
MNPLHWDWAWQGGRTPMRGLGSVIVIAAGLVVVAGLWLYRRKL